MPATIRLSSVSTPASRIIRNRIWRSFLRVPSVRSSNSGKQRLLVEKEVKISMTQFKFVACEVLDKHLGRKVSYKLVGSTTGKPAH